MPQDLPARAIMKRLSEFATLSHGVLFRMPPAALAAIAILLVGLPFALLVMPSGPTYLPLFKMVKDKTDVAAIAGELEQKKIPCLVSDGGRTILVERQNLEEAWMHVAQGRLIPRQYDHERDDFFGGNQAADLSPEAQRMRRQRNREAELAQTITDFEGIESARVHVTERPETLFRSEQRDPTASVVLGLTQGFKIGTGEVRSIIQVVCHSVPGLKPENVTIADRCGTEYTASGPQEPTTSAMDLLMGQYAEREIVVKVQNHLWPIFGAENCAITATVEIHMHRPEEPAPETIEAVGATGGVLAALRVGSEATTASGGLQEHRTCVLETVRVGGGPRLASVEQRRDGRQAILVRLGDSAAAPIVRRLFVSVLLNARALPGGRLTRSLRANLEADLKTAVGFDGLRGDTLSLVAAPFRVQGVSPPDTGDESFTLEGLLARHFNLFWLAQVGICVWILICIVRGGIRRDGTGPMICPVTVLQALGQRRPRVAWIEKGFAGLSDEDLARVAARTSDEDLALALRGIPDRHRDRILARLDAQRARRVGEIVARRDPVPLGRVERSIMNLVAAAGRRANREEES